MRILVTGGAGFIGSHVADGFRQAGHEVAVVDDLSTGNRANLDPSIKLYQKDIRDESLEDVFKDFRPEVVDHHAAQSNVPASMADPVYDASVNVLGGLNLLKLSAAHGVRKFIYISSGGAMYGEPDPQDLPVVETAPVRPLSPYGASKQALEAWLGVYQRTFGLDYTVLRYGNIFGPRQSIREEGAVVAVFATRMAADQPVTIDGTGEQTRDFVYVGDCVTANIAALERGSATSFNIGTGQETSIRTIFDAMAEVSGYSQKPSFGPARTGDVVRIVLNPARAKQHLGWDARMPLYDGLDRTFRFFRDGSA
ncbi:MAG TPA: NAD-dependent epimerase/dehydratase family protein [Chloroflexota bacterium]|nr:NAD-dependent epimerase/dehydratase family protein [Chloroflexota bacterium]